MEEQNTQQQNTGAPENSQPQPNMGQSVPQAGKEDVEKNKIMAIIGYILPILFFVPLLNEESKKSPFAKFHANQQLVLLIAAIAVNIVGSIIPVLGWFIILPLGSIFLIVVAIMGIIHAAKGEMKSLPAIGGFKIIK